MATPPAGPGLEMSHAPTSGPWAVSPPVVLLRVRAYSIWDLQTVDLRLWSDGSVTAPEGLPHGLWRHGGPTPANRAVLSVTWDARGDVTRMYRYFYEEVDTGVYIYRAPEPAWSHFLLVLP